MRDFGRMGDPPDFRDKRAKGGNPCLEQTLESYELCCLVETFPHNHESLDDFKRTLKVRGLLPGRSRWRFFTEARALAAVCVLVCQDGDSRTYALAGNQSCHAS